MSPSDPLETLYRDHAPALFRFLIRLTGDETEVKDVLQEIFLRLAKSPGLLRDVRSPRSFLFRLAHRLAIDRARRDETRHRYAERAQGEREIQGAVSTAPDPDESWRQKRLAESLAALPREQLGVLLLKVWEGFTFAEIAETLEIPPDTAASRYRYALDKLRDALRPLQEDLR